MSAISMDSENLLSIRTLERAHFSNADVVRTLLQQIVLLKDAGQRRVALRDSGFVFFGPHRARYGTVRRT
jgi:hypothetical protein